MASIDTDRRRFLSVSLKPKQMRGVQRRDTIIRSAAEMFLKNGYENTSVDSVIARSGGSRRNIYEWFGNKDALFAAVVRYLCDDLLVSMSDHDLKPDDPEGSLRVFGGLFVETLVSPPVVSLYRLVIGESERFPELGRIFYEAAPGVVIAKMADFLTACTERGTLKIEDPDLTARILVEMMKGDVHLRAVIAPCDEIEANIPVIVDRAVRIALHGMQT